MGHFSVLFPRKFFCSNFFFVKKLIFFKRPNESSSYKLFQTILFDYFNARHLLHSHFCLGGKFREYYRRNWNSDEWTQCRRTPFRRKLCLEFRRRYNSVCVGFIVYSIFSLLCWHKNVTQSNSSTRHVRETKKGKFHVVSIIFRLSDVKFGISLF